MAFPKYEENRQRADKQRQDHLNDRERNVKSAREQIGAQGQQHDNRDDIPGPVLEVGLLGGLLEPPDQAQPLDEIFEKGEAAPLLAPHQVGPGPSPGVQAQLGDAMRQLLRAVLFRHRPHVVGRAVKRRGEQNAGDDEKRNHLISWASLKMESERWMPQAFSRSMASGRAPVA